MKKRKLSYKIGVMIIAALIVLTGCQAVGGLDINKALIESMVPTSLEGQASLALDLVLDDKAEDDSRLAMLKLLEHVKLNLDSLKMENDQRMSVSGSITLAKHNVPFRAYLDGERLTVQVEGAKKPIVLDLASVGGSSGKEATGFIAELQKKLEDGKLIRNVLSYLVKQLPNPGKLNVSQVSDTVHGESLSLFKLHGEVTGQELLPLVKAFIVNMMKDDQALKELIGQIYDVLQPIVAAELDKATSQSGGIGGNGSEEDEGGAGMPLPGMPGSLGSVASSLSPLIGGLKAIWNDRDMAIEVLHTEVKQVLVIALVALQSIDGEQQQALKQIFGDTTYLTTDLYFDSALKLRKSNTALMVAPQVQNTGGLAAIRITSSAEYWNVGGNVKADPIDVSKGSLSVTKETKPADLLLNLDPQSELYKLLKNDLQVTKKTFYLSMAEGKYEAGTDKPFIDNEVTMVPTRFLVEKLGADIAWNGTTKEITVTDPLTSTTIVLKQGSREAKVNGAAVDMGHEVMVRDDTSYVPLSFIVSKLGGKTEWNDQLRMIRVTKE